MFAASIESTFIFLLIAGISALFNWLKKRSERGETSGDWPSENTPPPRPRKESQTVYSKPQTTTQPATNWEEELRKMLEGAVPTTRNPAPPPIPQKRKPATPPVSPRAQEQKAPTGLPKIFSEQKFYKAHCNYCEGHIEFPASAMEEVVPCPHCGRPTVLRPFMETPVEVLAHQHVSADFRATEKTYEEASQLSQRVAAHMQGVVQKPVGRTGIETARKPSPEIVRAEGLFKNARTVREAIVASVILAPPKAFEN